MLTDAELRDFLAEAERYPECIECRIIRLLIREIDLLKLDLHRPPSRPQPTRPNPNVDIRTGKRIT